VGFKVLMMENQSFFFNTPLQIINTASKMLTWEHTSKSFIIKQPAGRRDQWKLCLNTTKAPVFIPLNRRHAHPGEYTGKNEWP
jgi:hypothetical protein